MILSCDDKHALVFERTVHTSDVAIDVGQRLVVIRKDDFRGRQDGVARPASGAVWLRHLCT